jgi:CheY-like chemotaxis protein
VNRGPAKAAIHLVEAHHPEVAVIDISMPTLNGVDAARQLARSCPKTRVILLTQHEEEQYLHEALCSSDCRREVNKRRCFSPRHQRENGGIAQVQDHEEIGYP